MKIVLFIIAIFFTIGARAQVMQGKAQWATISVPQLKCWECEQRLNQYLIREKGPGTDAEIVQWKMDLRNATVKIQFIPDRMTLDYIRTAIANAGFDADTIKAEPDSYKILPIQCRKKEDGGGPFKYCELEPADRPKN
ncbi:MAG TPA: hypothetical protein VEV83_04610 [Parafilimonas sp.]|nr:hypothetical protein [Parafilimonas sp.]